MLIVNIRSFEDDLADKMVNFKIPFFFTNKSSAKSKNNSKSFLNKK